VIGRIRWRADKRGEAPFVSALLATAGGRFHIAPASAERVLCGSMPNRHRAPQQGTGTNPAMRMFVAFLAFYVAVIALALGLPWKSLLHWTGELLLIIGIALAAKGISDVRREWTGRLGFWGSIKQKAQAIPIRATSLLWARWNRAVEKWPRLAKRLHLRIHLTYRHSVDAMVSAETALATAAFPPARVVVSGDLTVEERLDQLESQMREAGEQIGTLNARHEQEVRVRQVVTEEERAARMAEDQRIRERMADLAGGGLKLQAWGVACLLAGTIITAIW
jgi:hypothetical protein